MQKKIKYDKIRQIYRIRIELKRNENQNQNKTTATKTEGEEPKKNHKNQRHTSFAYRGEL